MIHRTAGEGRGPSLFLSSTSTRSHSFIHLFATLHVRWLSCIFNRNVCIYKTITRWDLPYLWITIWEIVVGMIIPVCLLDDLILGFPLQQLTWETVRFELTSTITLVLQANRLSKCTSQPQPSVLVNDTLFTFYADPLDGTRSDKTL